MSSLIVTDLKDINSQYPKLMFEDCDAYTGEPIWYPGDKSILPRSKYWPACEEKRVHALSKPTPEKVIGVKRRSAEDQIYGKVLFVRVNRAGQQKETGEVDQDDEAEREIEEEDDSDSDVEMIGCDNRFCEEFWNMNFNDQADSEDVAS